MIEVISAFGREIVIVHNANKDVDAFQEIIQNLQVAGLKACTPGNRILVIADFTTQPKVTAGLLACPTDIDIKEALRATRNSLELLNESVFGMEQRKEAMIKLIDENL